MSRNKKQEIEGDVPSIKMFSVSDINYKIPALQFIIKATLFRARMLLIP
jgi:hypothetical protein